MGPILRFAPTGPLAEARTVVPSSMRWNTEAIRAVHPGIALDKKTSLMSESVGQVPKQRWADRLGSAECDSELLLS